MFFTSLQVSLKIFMLHKKNSGFSILEVIISAAIIGIVTAVVAVKYTSFNNVILLKSQAYEIALDIREAQVFAVSVRSEGGQYREDYGLYFSIGSSTQYRVFLDQGVTIEDGQNVAYYDAGEEVGPPQFIDSRFAISRICVNNISGCGTEVDDISVSFKRPDFDAQFASHDGLASGVGFISNAEITIANAFDNSITKTISISPTGQIDVD